MGTITISIDNATESVFREAVKNKLGVGKGKLGCAVTKAIQLWINKVSEDEIAQRQLKMLKGMYKVGKYKFKRDELHER